MRRQALFLLPCALLSAQLGLAQFGPDGISATVSRNVTLAPDEAGIDLLVVTDLGTTRQQVADVLAAAGFPAPVLVAVSTQSLNSYSPDPSVSAPQMNYQFAISVPATDLKDVSQKLEALRTSRRDPIQDVFYQSNLRASQTSVDDARQRLRPQLIAQARQQADALASAAGLKAGAVLGLSDNSYSPYPTYPLISSSVGGAWISSTGAGSSFQMTYSIWVKFAVN